MKAGSLAIAMVIGFVLLSGIPGIARAEQAAESVPGEYLVGFRPGAPISLPKDLIMETHPELGVARVRMGGMPAVVIEQLRRYNDVQYVEPNYIRRITAAPNDPYFAYSQYAPQKIKADKAWDVWKPTVQVTIAIVDTGIEYTHPDLKNVLLRDSKGTVVGYNTVARSANAADDNGHGTHVAGVAAGQINNGVGAAGVASWNPSVPNAGAFVRLMPVKVLNATGAGTDLNIADGITWAVDRGAKVINLSLGSTSYSSTFNNAVQYAWNRGCLVVAAAGNNSSPDLFYPAAYNNVISVGSTDALDTLSYFSNYGAWVKVAAPGSSILSTYKGDYTRLSGTSMASPHVAGEAAILLSQAPTLTNARISDAITGSTDSFSPYMGRYISEAGGRINVQKAMQSITGPAYTITTGTANVQTGASLAVSWTAPAGSSATDWIALFRTGDPNTVYGWWSFTGGASAGTLNATAPQIPGTYEFRYLLSGGYSDTARSGSITVETPAPSYILTASADRLTVGQPLSVTWNAPAGRPSTDWIGIFKSGDPNTAYGWWRYTGGAQTGGFSLTAPLKPGSYEFRYLLNNGYTDSARSGVIQIEAVSGNYTVSTSASAVASGGAVTVSWTAPSGRPYNDWVGLFKVGDPNTSYGWWRYTNGAGAGSFTMTVPLAPGTYEFRYLLENGFTDSARSSSISVGL